MFLYVFRATPNKAPDRPSFETEWSRGGCPLGVESQIVVSNFFGMPKNVPFTLVINTSYERGVTTGSKIMFSLSSVILFNMIGVDSCVFLIFTTRVGLKTG